MRKLIVLLVSSLFVFSGAYGADLKGVTGFEPVAQPKQSTAMTLVFSAVTDGKYVATVSSVTAIFTTDPCFMGTEEKKDPSGKSVWILRDLPDGTTLYSMGLGTESSGNADVNSVDLNKAKATGVVVDGMVKLEFARPTGQICYVSNWVIVLPDGKRAWGSNGSGYQVNVGSNPATAWCYDDTGVVKMDQDRKAELAAKR